MDCYQLQTVSSFSFFHSSVKADEYVDKLVHLGYQGGGIADVKTMFGFPSFGAAIEKTNLIPFFGMIVQIEDKVPSEENPVTIEGEIIVLNEAGYLNLISLFNLHKDKLSISDLSSFSTGLAFIVKTEDGKMKDGEYLEKINGLFYQLSHTFSYLAFGIEIYTKEESVSIKNTRDFALSHSYPALAFPKVLYLDREKSYQAYKILSCIETKEQMSEEDLTHAGPFFLLSPNAMSKVYLASEIAEQSSLAKLIHFKFMKKRGKIISSGSSDPEAELRKSALDGLNKRLGGNASPKYLERLEYELSIIHKMGYDDYFLIVQDYVNFAKLSNIKVGPGRGSACGSLVSYALNITEVDPLKYDLLFERFLNPLRVSMPDIDMDFEADRRGEILNYLKNKYGPERFGLIVTFQTNKLKAALGNIGTVFNYPESRVEAVSKTISPYLKSETFTEEINGNYRFKKLMSDPYFKGMVEKASLILDYPWNTSLHAAGIVLSSDPLRNVLPVLPNQDGTLVVGYEYPTLEDMGFLKMDILALINLNLVHETENIIKEASLPLPVPYADLNNKKAFEALNKLQVEKIFQLESEGIKRTISQIKPNSVEELAALLAIYRPGPMESRSIYADRKNKGVSYTSGIPALDNILKDTYGIILYQEQIMKIATSLAGFDGGKADLLRRAIAKKDALKMAGMKQSFISGCTENKISESDAKKVFELIEKFADYGFNKSHAVGYAFLSSYMLYLKANYPWAFYLAAMRDVSLSSEDMANLTLELYDYSYSIASPSVNESEGEMIFKDGRFIIGLNQIKGINERLSKPIIDERKNGPFKSLGDFFRRVDLNDFSERELTSLIDAGCFDKFGYARSELKNHISELRVVGKFASPEAGDEILPAMEKIKENHSIEEYLAEYAALGTVASFELKDLIVGEKTYHDLYLVSDDPHSVGPKTRLDVVNRYVKKGLYILHNPGLVKYDIISVKEDPSAHFGEDSTIIHKEEKKR